MLLLAGDGGRACKIRALPAVRTTRAPPAHTLPRGAPLLRHDWGGRTRTCNLPVNSRPLCPLSYTPSAGLVSTPAAGAPAYLLAAPPAPSPLSNLTVREGGIKPGVTRLDPPCSTPCTRGKPPG